MAISGYVDYKRREYCKDVKCPVQAELESKKENSPEYNELRNKCGNGCIHTTYEFHHWLVQKGYLIVKPERVTIQLSKEAPRHCEERSDEAIS